MESLPRQNAIQIPTSGKQSRHNARSATDFFHQKPRMKPENLRYLPLWQENGSAPDHTYTPSPCFRTKRYFPRLTGPSPPSIFLHDGTSSIASQQHDGGMECGSPSLVRFQGRCLTPDILMKRRGTPPSSCFFAQKLLLLLSPASCLAQNFS